MQTPKEHAEKVDRKIEDTVYRLHYPCSRVGCKCRKKTGEAIDFLKQLIFSECQLVAQEYQRRIQEEYVPRTSVKGDK